MFLYMNLLRRIRHVTRMFADAGEAAFWNETNKYAHMVIGHYREQFGCKISGATRPPGVLTVSVSFKDSADISFIQLQSIFLILHNVLTLFWIPAQSEQAIQSYSELNVTCYSNAQWFTIPPACFVVHV